MKIVSEIYVALVCFISLGFITLYSMESAHKAVAYYNPEMSISAVDYRGHQSDESYLFYIKSYRYKRPENIGSGPRIIALGEKDNFVPPSPEQLTLLRQESWQNTIEDKRRHSKKSFIENAINLLVVSVIFGLHWFLFMKFRKKD